MKTENCYKAFYTENYTLEKTRLTALKLKSAVDPHN